MNGRFSDKGILVAEATFAEHVDLKAGRIDERDAPRSAFGPEVLSKCKREGATLTGLNRKTTPRRRRHPVL
jgi:hypothetical protein